ncbi:MAG: hypothetical protein ACE144_01355 [Thermodesulfobacteriota bacterium]
MKRAVSLILSAVVCLTLGTGYVAGTRQDAGADEKPYGKYVFSADPTQYVELRPDSSCVIGIRVLGPSGGFEGTLQSFSGTYEIKGDIVTLKPVMHGKAQNIEFRLEGNTLVPPKYQGGTDRMRKTMEGAKYIRK